MFRFLYSLLHLFLMPVLIFFAFRRARAEKAPLRLKERLGIKLPLVNCGVIWIHGCSLGESLISVRITKHLKKYFPNNSFLITATTPSGFKIIDSSIGGVTVGIFPWDLPWIWSRWLSHVKPKALIIVETELWPNLLANCNKKNIPVVLANGRLSHKSVKGYKSIEYLSRPMWKCLSLVMMQDKDGANFAYKLGASKRVLRVTGSIKLDAEPPPVNAGLLSRLRSWRGSKQVVCLSSSHPGEEALLLKCLSQSRTKNSFKYRLLLIPRHPVRAEEIRSLSESYGFDVMQVSVDRTVPLGSIVAIGDTFGDMSSYLNISDLVIIGGTFANRGGQSPVESALASKAMILGPSVYNFSYIAHELENHEALERCKEKKLCELIDVLLSDDLRRTRMGHNAYRWASANSGATDRQVELIIDLIRSSIDS